MTTTVYYGDNFEPTQWNAIVGTQPEWTAALYDSDTEPRTTLIRYTLYADTTTFENWITWAQKNKISTNTNDVLYDGAYVLGMIGRWPMLIDDNDTADDAMCINDVTNSRGAICIVTSKTDATTKTYNFTSADWGSFYTSIASTVAGTDDSTATDIAAAIAATSAVEQVVYTNADPTNAWFEGFQKFYCEDYSDGIELECRAWSRAIT